jgi:hypothetical protein
MGKPVEIENIEEMRRREGIEDVELREGIRRLRVGDFVRVTLLLGRAPLRRETLLVRITGIKGATFRGKLANTPGVADLGQLRVGAPLGFTVAHIHSLAKGRPMKRDAVSDTWPSPGTVASPNRSRVRTETEGPSMTTKTIPPSRYAARLDTPLPPAPWQPPCLTTEERLQQIEVMGQRINGYVQFIREVGALGGSSGEAKDRAVADFYEHLVILEGQLCRIHEDLRLG